MNLFKGFLGGAIVFLLFLIRFIFVNFGLINLRIQFRFFIMSNQIILLFDGITSGAVIFVSLVFSILFWVSFFNKSNESLRFLALMYSVLSLFFVFSVIFYISYSELVRFLFPLSLPLVLLILPLFNLYVQSITCNKKMVQGSFYLHFLLAVLFLLLLIPFYVLPKEIQLNFVMGEVGLSKEYPILTFVRFIYRIGVLLVLNLQFIYYLYKFGVSYIKYKKKIEECFSYSEEIDLRWLLYTMYAFIALFVLLDISKFIEVKNYFSIRTGFNLTILILITYLGTHALFQKKVFCETNELVSIKNSIIVNVKNLKPINEDGSVEKYKKSNLSQDKKAQIKDEIISILQSGSYRNPMLGLEHLAETIGTNSTYLSQVINEEFHQNFYQLVNRYRVEEAVRLLVSSENNIYTVEAIAQQCGFRSKSSFNSAFKKLTQSTPSSYRKSIKS